MPPIIHHQEYADSQAAPTAVTDMDLGLTLAQNVARLHGGELTIGQEGAHALTVVLWLPGVEAL
jgi:hypothetical protein